MIKAISKIIFIFSINLLFNGCLCTENPDLIQLDGFEIIKKKRNYTSKENLLIEYHFLSHVKEPKKKLCAIASKEMAVEISSDNVLSDSTKVFCDNDLLFNQTIIAKNTDLLDYQFTQFCNTPSSINKNLIGGYYVNLSQFSFNTNKNYIFTIQVQTNHRILNDTFQISINP